jgi:hypothetical protein
MVKATRLTVPVSLASDLVPFIDCVPDNKCAERLPVTICMQAGPLILSSLRKFSFLWQYGKQSDTS